MKRYRTVRVDNSIECCEVERETRDFVVFKSSYGRTKRELKRGYYQRWHETWAEARAYLMGRAKDRITAARTHLDAAHRDLAQVEAMTEPEP